MASGTSDPQLAAVLDRLAADLDGLHEVGVEPTDAADARVLIAELEVIGRRVRASQVALLAAVERRGLHRADGHASAKVLVRHVAGLADDEAARRAKAARTLRDLPEVASAFAAGEIGSCQIACIGRAHANPRVRERVCRQDEALAFAARTLPYRQFDRLVTDWVRRADEDGTCDRAQRAHEARDARLAQDFDGGWSLTARCGSLQGAELETIYRHFFDAETLTDWEKARIDHGDAATVDDLPRTIAQRRFDALFEIHRRAADAHATAEGGPQIVTNVVVDHETFERIARRLAGDDGPPLRPDTPLVDDRPVGFRCSTLDGHTVDPTEAVANALVGYVRRVVMGTGSVIIDLGRRRRLFTGAAQLAVKLANTHCYWPGCHVPVSRCQADHMIPWADHGGGGPTNPGNGAPACGKHNRHKERGYRVWRDQTGTWHTHRPDGTEIT